MAVLAPDERFDNAIAFLERLSDIRSLGQHSQQQAHIPQGGVDNAHPEVVLREDVIFPHLLGGYVFRGQGDASWGLIPSVFRPGKLAEFHDGLPDRFSWDHPFWRRLFVKIELELVRAFSWLAQEMGLETPHKIGKFERILSQVDEPCSDSKVDEVLDQICDISNPNFAEVAEELAVAQHHGIPTRLLDWTEDPYLAAYFAAETSRCHTDIAVFALDTSNFYYPTDFIPGRGNNKYQQNIAIVRAPRARELFIQRQKGLFTMTRSTLSRHRAFGFDLLRFMMDLDKGIEGRPSLFKLVLPAKAVADLRVRLHRDGYRHHSVYPSLRSIAASIKETETIFGRAQHEYHNILDEPRFELYKEERRWTIRPPRS
jgi:hypothetical protein